MRTRWSLGVLAVCGAIAAWRATAFLPALNAAQPLATTVPAVIGERSPRLAQRVVLVIVDGLRSDAAVEMLTLSTLARDGSSGVAKAPFPTLSLPNYVTIATGVVPRYSGYRTNDLLTADGDAIVRLDSLFARVRAAGLRAGYASTRETAMPALFGHTFDAVAESWDAIARDDLSVVVLMGVDRAGHRHGGASDEYREAARAIDKQLAEIYRTLNPEHDVMIVTADHGHSDRGGHGGDSEAMASVPVAMAGAGVRRGAKLTAVELADLAPTIAALLGLPAPGHGGGSTLIDALAIDVNQAAALVAADARRHAVIDAAERQLDATEDERHRSALLVCLPIAVLAMGGIGGVLLAARKRWHLGGAAVAIGATFPIVFFGLISLGERWMSEPGVPGDRLSMWLESAPYGFAASVASVVVHAIAMRVMASRGWRTEAIGRRAEVVSRRRAAEVMLGAVIVGLAIVVGVAIALWVVAGGTLATMLPSPVLVVITPVAYMAVAWYALAAIVVLAGSALVAGDARSA